MSDAAVRVSGRALASRDGHRGQDASQPDEFKELSGQGNFTRNSPKASRFVFGPHIGLTL